MHVNLAQLVEIFEQLVTTQVKGQVDVSLCGGVAWHVILLLYNNIVFQYLGLWDILKTAVDEMGAHQTKSPGNSSVSSPNNSLTTATGELSPRRKEHTASPFV